jgi:hypothetical protein
MNTQNILKYFSISIFFFWSLIFVSCEEVITLDLENTKSSIVIESIITDNDQPFKVKISHSQDFYNSGDYETIDNAAVVLTDNAGLYDTLVNIGNGIYAGNSVKGINGNTYKLEVLYDGINYQATNTLPIKTELDSLNYEWVEYPHTNGYLVNMHFTDEPDVKNYYRVKVLVSNNEVKDDKVGLEYLLYDDKLFDGKNTKLPALRGSRLLKAYDTVTIELYSLSPETYNYYKTLSNIIAVNRSALGLGQTMIEGSSAPANPITNFDNGALGYFGAYSVSRKTIVLKPNN